MHAVITVMADVCKCMYFSCANYIRTCTWPTFLMA